MEYETSFQDLDPFPYFEVPLVFQRDNNFHHHIYESKQRIYLDLPLGSYMYCSHDEHPNPGLLLF